MAASGSSIWDHPDPRGLPVVQGLLRVIVAVQCWGAAAHRLRSGSLSELGQLLFHDLSASSPEGIQFDRMLGIVLLVVGLVTLVRPVGAVLIAVTAGFAGHAIGQLVMPDDSANWFSFGEQLVRVAAPLALLLVDWWPPKLKFALGRFLFALGALRVSAAISIAAQGLRALLYLPDRARMLEMVQKGSVALSIPDKAADQAHLTLGLLGGIDVGMAIVLILTRSKLAAAVVGAWSLARISLWAIALGPEGYPETLVRAAEAGVPFVLAAFAMLAVKEHSPEILPIASAKTPASGQR